ncbi:LytR family transcriptional attenuator [Haloactinopolyspora alba]|uniref:LytR family transcriptional attenuator n=1 Tax=Haloactinopolyspora alba TaxID=648780 RepID=A0A2P8E0X8_9ACTN|nr:LCP family protein [Haloactinopolyspora alba]PSL03124.1 LytR family transcriptional attenuator [Haloactinopolyspora alba]
MGTAARPPGPRRQPARRRPAAALRAEREEAARFRRSLTLVGLSVVAPGCAQFIAGHRKTGKIALWTAAGLAAVTLLVLWLVPLEDLATLAVRPWLLTTFKILAFGAAACWVGLLVDAWRLGHPPGLNQKHRLIMVGSTLALAAMVATPFVVAARYATAAHDAVVAMFPSGEVAAASDGRLNILLLGADAGDGRVGVRPDSINLVSVDVRTGEPAVISLPRNLEKARFPDGTPADEQFPDGFSGEGERSDYMLNATWTYGEEHPDMFPGPSGPGPTAVKQAVEGTLGLPVHYYVAVDLDGFRDIINAIGGITIRVEEELPIGEKGRVLEPGLQELDGYHALWYARSREGSSDYARMARQRCVLGALLKEAKPGTLLANFLDLAEASKTMITTDIPREDLTNLVDLGLKAKDQEMTALQFVPPLIAPADPDFDLIAAETQAFLDGAVETGDGNGSGGSGSAGDGAAGDGAAGDGNSASSPDGSGDGDATGEGADVDAGSGGEEGSGSDASEPVGVSSVCSYE